MDEDSLSLMGYLTTTGRITGRPHTVRLRLVSHQGRVYASRRDTRSDWCRNLLTNPVVIVDVGDRRFSGTARLVTDQDLCKEISRLKYTDQRSLEPRTVIEISPMPG